MTLKEHVDELIAKAENFYRNASVVAGDLSVEGKKELEFLKIELAKLMGRTQAFADEHLEGK